MSVVATNLSKTYGQQKAVNDISFDVAKGQILGFLGPNGAGKSTTMKMLTGFITPSAGHIQIAGIDMAKNALEARRIIGYLPESNPLYLDMYVKEYLSFIAGIYQLDQKSAAISKVIEMTGLGPEQHKPIRQLSKGYKQRVGLAQALIHDPEILILDEPTSGFDPNQLGEIRTLIKGLGKDKTIIFSTHIMQEVQAVCSRVMIINQGKVVADDTVEQLGKKLSGNVSVTIHFEKAVEAKSLEALPVVQNLLRLDERSFQISGSNAAELKKVLFQWAVDHQNPIVGLSEQKADLEQIFKSLTQKDA